MSLASFTTTAPVAVRAAAVLSEMLEKSLPTLSRVMLLLPVVVNVASLVIRVVSPTLMVPPAPCVMSLFVAVTIRLPATRTLPLAARLKGVAAVTERIETSPLAFTEASDRAPPTAVTVLVKTGAFVEAPGAGFGIPMLIEPLPLAPGIRTRLPLVRKEPLSSLRVLSTRPPVAVTVAPWCTLIVPPGARMKTRPFESI